MLNSKRMLFAGVTAIAALTLASSGASAVPFTSSFTEQNGSLGSTTGAPGPYGMVTITLTSSTTANVTFTDASDANNTYLFIDTSAADLSVNSTNITVSSLTGVAALGTTPANGNLSVNSLPQGTQKNVDGMGVFNLTIDNMGASGNPLSSISFTLTDNSGTWSSPANVLTDNGSGNDAAAHMVPCTLPCTSTSQIQTNNTGFVAENAINTDVPEPGTFALLASTIAAFGLSRRRRSSGPNQAAIPT
jgi:hypothetical protein